MRARCATSTIQGPEIHGTYTDGRAFNTYAPNDPSLVQRLYGKGVQITARPPGENVPWFVSLLVSWLPFIALIGVWIFLSRQMQGGGRQGARLRQVAREASDRGAWPRHLRGRRRRR